MKVKDRMNSCGIKEIKKIWQLNVMCHIGLDPGAGKKILIKDIIGTISKIQVSSVD